MGVFLLAYGVIRHFRPSHAFLWSSARWADFCSPCCCGCWLPWPLPRPGGEGCRGERRPLRIGKLPDQFATASRRFAAEDFRAGVVVSTGIGASVLSGPVPQVRARFLGANLGRLYFESGRCRFPHATWSAAVSTNPDSRTFITLSCYRRQPNFVDAAVLYDLFPLCLEDMRRRFDMRVYGYVVMPEHVHLLMSEPEHGTLAETIHYLKLSFAKRPRSQRIGAPGSPLLWANLVQRNRVHSGKNAITTAT